ncbi:hypothetical protein LR48_Vigan1020s001400 [Vigna angularis]|uniref:Uncharacterized protein n=1 Tax=Phaseolus angularis TaxID=3914 RepID=A0A0L9TJ81_PHAAN|nr:hypothetical protein LR48_Vigan1020s001400 [Vigna angularis]
MEGMVKMVVIHAHDVVMRSLAPTDGGGGAVAEYKLLLEEDVSDESEASVLHCWRCK